MKNTIEFVKKITEQGAVIAFKNELLLLSLIAKNGWVREFELSLLSGMDKQMIYRTIKRLELAGEVNRRWCNNSESDLAELAALPKKFEENENDDENKKLAKKQFLLKKRILKKNVDTNKACFFGHFLTLTTAGSRRLGIDYAQHDVPKLHWRHTCGSIQTLHFLCSQLNQNEIVTEKELISHKDKNKLKKIPDGTVMPLKPWFEFERAHKSGGKLDKQNEYLIDLLKNTQDDFYLAYCYQPKNDNDFQYIPNHELSLTNSLNWLIGETSPRIKFVRCYFDNELDYKRMIISKFEIIEMPKIKSTDFIKKLDKSVSVEKREILQQVDGWSWECEFWDSEVGYYSLKYRNVLQASFKFVAKNKSEGNYFYTKENQLWITQEKTGELRAIDIESMIDYEVTQSDDFDLFVKTAMAKAVLFFSELM